MSTISTSMIRSSYRARVADLDVDGQPAADRAAWTRRYVELADTAEARGLNHGKFWTCGELDIQTKGAHPSWEGEAICYVYEHSEVA